MTRRIARAALLCSVVAVTACATSIASSASNIARLETAGASKPRSESAQRSLGIAYFEAKRYDDAHAALDRAASLDARDGVVALYRGLTAEAQNDVPAARSAYESYLRYGKTRAVKNQIAARLVVLARMENELAAKQAIARERQLSSVPGSPRTVAVLPFAFTGADTSLAPLERGFAELVATDLSRSSQLTVVERARLQALLDEIRLQQTAGVQAGTGIRAGKLLQAGRIVGGTIAQLDSNQIRADAFVTNVQTTRTEGGANDQQTLDQLFTLEKNIVLRLFTDLGVSLTTAERDSIEQRPTRSLAAFLSYSRGLEAEDDGRFDAARRFFDDAVRLDPSFGSARQRSRSAKAEADGVEVSAGSVESSLRGTVEGASVATATGVGPAGATDGQAFAIADGLNPSAAGGATAGGVGTPTQPQKDPSSGTGGDNVASKIAIITIVIHHP